MPDPSYGKETEDTIFAPATGDGLGAIAIIRISGPRAHEAILQLAGPPLPDFRVLTLRTLSNPDGETLDQALIAVFPEGSSYTGEPMAEIQCHGGRAVLHGLIDSLNTLPGFRLATPGEFTRRSLMNGQIGPNEVEGLRDLIAAETDLQRRQALRMHSGTVSRLAEKWRGDLLRARALLEVTIDFADEEVPEDLSDEVSVLVDRTLSGMDIELTRAGPAERLREGYEVAIMGPPNVGKSSLLNAIVGREAAIVSEIAGTTRDIVEARIDLGGLAVTFLDTAGLREATESIEAMGVERARCRAAAADLRLWLSSADVNGEMETDLWREEDFLIRSKCDLGRRDDAVNICTHRDEGIGDLLAQIRSALADRAKEAGVLVTARQKGEVESARRALTGCAGALASGSMELAAEELRAATAALDRLAGRIGVEDVLGEIFAGFCLGK